MIPVAHFHSPLGEKFGTPRQAGLANHLRGEVILEKEFSSEDWIRGLEGFDYIWLLWGFNLNQPDISGDECSGRYCSCKATVRPPRLGGNERVGVFASRSPFRPNPIGLSSVRLEKAEAGLLHVLGADLADGTPIYDIKPYLEYTDSHQGIRNGYVDRTLWGTLQVIIPDSLRVAMEKNGEDVRALAEILSQDPRPGYHNDSQRIYGLDFNGHNVRFSVAEGVLTVLG